MKHQPQRRCVGCMTSYNKNTLIRVLRKPNNEIIVDPTGGMDGRGVYLCRNAECLKKAEKGGKIARAFKQSISRDIYQLLEEQINVQNNQ